MLCMYVCVYRHVNVCIDTRVTREQPKMSCLSSRPTLISEAGSLAGLELMTRLVSPRDPSVSTPALGLQVCNPGYYYYLKGRLS